MLPDDPEAVIDRLENRLAGQTSEVLRMRKSAQTSQALLDLHTACTRQRTVAGTARQIAAVASAITGSEVVIVSVFQVASQQPLLAVSLSDGIIDEEHIGNLVCDMATQPDMQWLRTENSLRVVDRESATPSTALLLAELQRRPSAHHAGVRAGRVRRLHRGQAAPRRARPRRCCRPRRRHRACRTTPVT